MVEKKVYLAVDAANLLYSLDRGMRVNYETLLELARQRGHIVESAIYFSSNNSIEKDRSLLIALKFMGYTKVISRPLRRRPDKVQKSDVDIALAIDLWETVLRDRIDVVVLVSGDSDFIPLIERLTQRGVEVDIVGPHGSTAWEMIVGSTRFLRANEIDGLIYGAASTISPVQETLQLA